MMPRVNVFEPTKSKWFIIYNKEYDKFRNQHESFKNFADIIQAEEDAMNFKNGIIAMGANPDDIITMPNPSQEELQ